MLVPSCSFLFFSKVYLFCKRMKQIGFWSCNLYCLLWLHLRGILNTELFHYLPSRCAEHYGIKLKFGFLHIDLILWLLFLYGDSMMEMLRHTRRFSVNGMHKVREGMKLRYKQVIFRVLYWQQFIFTSSC